MATGPFDCTCVKPGDTLVTAATSPAFTSGVCGARPVRSMAQYFCTSSGVGGSVTIGASFISGSAFTGTPRAHSWPSVARNCAPPSPPSAGASDEKDTPSRFTTPRANAVSALPAPTCTKCVAPASAQASQRLHEAHRRRSRASPTRPSRPPRRRRAAR